MNTKQLIQALSVDLYRAATGFHRGSIKTANIFSREAQEKMYKIQENTSSPYLKKLIVWTLPLLARQDGDAAEHLLMYSNLFKNYSLKRMV